MNSGKELERLVQEIEQSLLPSGFAVALNKREFNEAGHQIAEFDIEISGRLGSSLVKWLIECRDRPSEGPQPGSWIEQLVTRRSRFKFDKVIAVSTTGFTKGAMEFAESQGPSVRSVQSIGDIASDFNIQGTTYYAHQVTIGPTDLAVTNPALAEMSNLAHAEFKLVGEKDYQNFPDFVLSYLDGVDKSQLTTDTQFRFEFCCEDPLDVICDGRHVRVGGLVLPLQLDIFLYDGKMLSANMYSERGEMIGRDVTYVFDLPSGSFTQRVLLLNNFDGTQRIQMPPPENVPEGFSVSFCDIYVEEP